MQQILDALLRHREKQVGNCGVFVLLAPQLKTNFTFWCSENSHFNVSAPTKNEIRNNLKKKKYHKLDDTLPA